MQLQEWKSSGRVKIVLTSKSTLRFEQHPGFSLSTYENAPNGRDLSYHTAQLLPRCNEGDKGGEYWVVSRLVFCMCKSNHTFATG